MAKAADFKPYLKNPLKIIGWLWHKYSEFFDKGSWGIWGLSPILKYTLLYFFVFFTPALFGWARFEEGSTFSNYATIFIFGALIIGLIWFIYLPILFLILFFRSFKKTARSAAQLKSYLADEPWDITPIKLYTQPQRPIVVYLIMFKYYLIDALDWTTQFYPISLLSTSPIPYPISMKIRHIARSFEMRIAGLKIPFKYVDFEINQNFTLLRFEPYQNINDLEKVFNKLDKKLKHEISFFIRQENGRINIIVPHAQ